LGGTLYGLWLGENLCDGRGQRPGIQYGKLEKNNWQAGREKGERSDLHQTRTGEEEATRRTKKKKHPPRSRAQRSEKEEGT